MANYKNITESGLVKIGQGALAGFVVNTHSSGTLKVFDGTEPSVVATSTLTSSGACVPAYHAQNVLTSTGAMVPATHAYGTLTSGGTNFLDAVKASAVLTSDETNITTGDTVTVGTQVWRFQTTPSLAFDVKVGATAKESMDNLYAGLINSTDCDIVRTSDYVITVYAKTAGTDGNSIAKAEASSHLDWDGVGAVLTGGLAAETVTIGAITYTFRNGKVDDLYEVVIGSTLTLSLLNLKNAINGNYGAGGFNASTPAHSQVVGYTSDGTTCVVRGRVPGTSLNAVATTETCADAAWGDTTLEDGVATTAATITMGATTYTVVVALSETYGASAIANQVLYGGSEAVMLDNLKLAINGTGTAGTNYSTGTTAHTYFVATTNTDTAQTIRARAVGNAAYTAIVNALATTETLANTTWADSTCGGGTGNANPSVTSDAATFTINGRTYTAVLELSETLGAAAVADQILWVTSEAVFLDNIKLAINASGTAGTEYSTGTTQNIDCVATTNDNTTQIVNAKIAGIGGNAFTTSTTLANYSWTSTVMASGAGAAGKVLLGTITFPAVTVGPLTYNFPDPLACKYGIYCTIGGTVDITMNYL